METLNVKKLNDSMKEYKRLDNELQNKFNTETKNMLYFVFGTSENEIIEKLEKEYNLNVSEIISIGCGGYIKKSDVEKFNNLNEYIMNSKKEFCKDKYNCCGLYLDRLWDYESRIGFGDDYERALNDLLSYMNVKNVNELDKELVKMLILTEKYYNKEFDRLNGY